MNQQELEAMMAEGDTLMHEHLLSLSVAPYLTTPLIKVLLQYSGLWKESTADLWNNSGFLTSTGCFAGMNGVGPSNTPDFFFVREKRQPLHAELRKNNPELFRRLHYFLYRMAAGLSWRTVEVVAPGYLRTKLGAAYHGSYDNENVGLVDYEALRELHRLDPSPESKIYSNTSLVWEAGRLLKEQKEFGLFRDEPITDEIVDITATL